jgi:hypothetical protein
MKECDALIFKWHASETRGMLWEIVNLLVFCKSDPNVDLIFGCYLGHPTLPRLSRSRPCVDASVQECICKTRKKNCLCKLLLLLVLVFCELVDSPRVAADIRDHFHLYKHRYIKKMLIFMYSYEVQAYN